MRAEWGETTQRIERLLRLRGPMTRAAIGEALNMDRRQLSAVVSRMAKKTKTLPKRLYITAYVYEHGTSRRYPRAVFALGDRKNCPRPKPNRQEVRRRYDEKVKMQMTSNSIFNLGLSRSQYLARRREILKGAGQ